MADMVDIDIERIRIGLVQKKHVVDCSLFEIAGEEERGFVEVHADDEALIVGVGAPDALPAQLLDDLGFPTAPKDGDDGINTLLSWQSMGSMTPFVMPIGVNDDRTSAAK